MFVLTLSVARITRLPFASQMNFLDQPFNEDGTPYGPTKYKELVRERYFISKHSNISYSDTGKMSPVERGYVRDFIIEELKEQQKILDKINEKSGRK